MRENQKAWVRLWSAKETRTAVEDGNGTAAADIAIEIPKAKPHFAALDGLRGIAALAIVSLHLTEIVISDYSRNFIGHGFLAVDFFFCLSGFVIGYAYDDRVQKMGLAEFLKSRLIRLHPLVILGSVLGLMAYYLDPFASTPPGYGAGRVALIFLSSVLLLPYPVMKQRLFSNFSFNAPAWSLFWEYIANILYATVIYRLGRRSLMALTATAALVLTVCAHHAGSMSGGWSGPTFWYGGVRVAFSFAAGLLIFRMGWRIKTRLGFTGVAILLLAALMMPYLRMLWLQESLLIVLYFPLLIVLGAGVTLGKRSESFSAFMGGISYPLYMTHYAAISIFEHYYKTYKPSHQHVAWILIVSVPLMIAFAYLSAVLYDIPLRRYLTSRRLARPGLRAPGAPTHLKI